jgi:nitrogen fixation NifU-like protein
LPVAELRELYQQIIRDHNRAPRNFKQPETANREASGNNPICGDRITVYVNVDDNVIEDIGFQGSGCAISRASSSLMTAAVKGKTVQEARELFRTFHDMVTGTEANPDKDRLGKLAVFGGVREFPARVKCASLPWHTLKAALEDFSGSVTTE